MGAQRVTLSQFLINQQQQHPNLSSDLISVILDIAKACKGIAQDVALGPLRADKSLAAGALNVQNEIQLWQDIAANERFIQSLCNNPSVAGMLSEEMPSPYWTDADPQTARYLLAFDPLDGSSNIDVNVSVGSIFSVLSVPDLSSERSEDEFLQPGNKQIAAGYALYGPTTAFVLTVGTGTFGFTLEPNSRDFILTQPHMKLPSEASVFAINTSNSRFWNAPVRHYIEECLAGANGPRGKDFNMRWIASLVAEAHRILLRGGVFLYPGDTREATREGRLRLLYEANPIGMLIEQASGAASTGFRPVLGVEPSRLHQRIGFVFGSSDEVRRIERYHADGLGDEFINPLFNRSGLFRALA